MTGQDVFVKRRVFYPANVFLCVLGHNKQHVSSFNYGKIRTTRAVLVAISIPIFTSQLEKAREATDVANIRSAYAEAAAEAITAEVGSTITKSTNKMQSSGAIDKIASESVGPWDSSKITITAGTAATVTATVGDNGNTTFALSGGATVAN